MTQPYPMSFVLLRNPLWKERGAGGIRSGLT